MENIGNKLKADKLYLSGKEFMAKLSDISLKGNESIKIWNLPEGCEFRNEKWHLINAKSIFMVEKESIYPKTYEECCKIMGIEYPFIKKNEDTITASCYKNNLIVDFVQLLICRDAYWKIAGDWKPDWEDYYTKHCIIYRGEKIRFETSDSFSQILSFPTKEMRDVFYDNFVDLIEQCKELL